MSWEFTPWTIPLFLSAAVSGLIAVYSWRMRQLSGGMPLVLLTSAAAIWALSDALTIMSNDLDQYMFWWNVSYIGIVAVSPAWLLFALDYTGNSSWTTPRRAVLISATPAISLLLVWTEPHHGLMWTVHGVAHQHPYLIPSIERGVWFWVYSVASYTCVIIGSILLIWIFSRSYRHLSVRALMLMLLTVALPTGTNLAQAVARTYDIVELNILDLTPYTFWISTPALAIAVFHYRIQDLAPVSREAVIERIEDGILLFDTQFVVLDANAAGASMFNRTDKETIGWRLEQISPVLASLLNREQAASGQHEIEMREGDGAKPGWYNFSFSVLRDIDGSLTGYAIALRDITERKFLEQQLAYQAHHDALTGLANRTMLEQELDQRLEQLAVDRVLALAFLDLDGFKEVNDQLGHQAGDKVLKEVAKELLAISNVANVIARWGGDEFALLAWLPADRLAAHWARQIVEACNFTNGVGPSTIPVSASVGVSVADRASTSDQLIREADSAMYRAKRSGKNRFSIARSIRLTIVENEHRLAGD